MNLSHKLVPHCNAVEHYEASVCALTHGFQLTRCTLCDELWVSQSVLWMDRYG